MARGHILQNDALLLLRSRLIRLADVDLGICALIGFVLVSSQAVGHEE